MAAIDPMRSAIENGDLKGFAALGAVRQRERNSKRAVSALLTALELAKEPDERMRILRHAVAAEGIRTGLPQLLLALDDKDAGVAKLRLRKNEIVPIGRFRARGVFSGFRASQPHFFEEIAQKCRCGAVIVIQLGHGSAAGIKNSLRKTMEHTHRATNFAI